MIFSLSASERELKKVRAFSISGGSPRVMPCSYSGKSKYKKGIFEKRVSGRLSLICPGHWSRDLTSKSSQTLYFTALNLVDICLFDCASCLLLHNKVESNINFLSVKYRYGPYKGHLWAGWAVQITHWEKGFSNRRPNIYVKNHQCLEFLTLFTATLKISRTCHDAKG